MKEWTRHAVEVTCQDHGRKAVILARVLKNSSVGSTESRRHAVIKWSVVFFIIAILAAVLGFGGIAAGATDVARVLFFMFLAMFVISLIWEWVIGKRSLPPL